MKGETRPCKYCGKLIVKKRDEQVSCGSKECKRAALSKAAHPTGFKNGNNK